MSVRRALPLLWLASIARAAVVFAVTYLLAFGGAALRAADEPAATGTPPEATASTPATAGSPAASSPAATETAQPPAASGTPAAGTTATGTTAAPGATATPGAATTAAPIVPVTTPKLVAESVEQDAGKVRKGKKLEVEFTLANQGDGPLKIKDAQPSCGCTVASFDKEIAPGASGKIRARVNTDSFDGPIAKHITVLSNDPVAPKLVLTIKADVQAFLRASPSYARILQVQSQEPEKVGVNLWSTDGKALEIRSIKTPFPWVVATARRPTDAERTPEVTADQWRLEVSLAPDAPIGPLKDSIRVMTNHPEEPEIEIPLSGNVRTVLHFQPGEVDFGKLVRPMKEAKRFVVKLFNFGKDPVELRSVETDLPFVTVSFSAEEAGRRYRVELLLAADAPKGKLEGHLKAETSSATMPTVEIPVLGKVE